MSDDPTFEVHVDPSDRVGETLLLGLSNVGVAGLTAIDYLVRNLECDQVGRVTAHDYPSITPFVDGTPRHHTRLYCVKDAGITAMASELLLPVQHASRFVDAVLDWAAGEGIEEVVVLNGVPFQHDPEEHAVFQVATESFQERRLEGAGLAPLRGGFLDGVPGELLARSLEGAGPPTGVYVTPTHPPGPDLDAALLFLDAIEQTHGVAVDRGELERLSEETRRYYQELAERMQTRGEEGDRSGYPEDMAFM